MIVGDTEGGGINMAEKALVVRGGRLIDGTGRPAIEDSVIVMQAGRFQAVGARGEISIPADAEVIDVKGKSVLPGFIDGHGLNRVMTALLAIDRLV